MCIPTAHEASLPQLGDTTSPVNGSPQVVGAGTLWPLYQLYVSSMKNFPEEYPTCGEQEISQDLSMIVIGWWAASWGMFIIAINTSDRAVRSEQQTRSPFCSTPKF